MADKKNPIDNRLNIVSETSDNDAEQIPASKDASTGDSESMKYLLIGIITIILIGAGAFFGAKLFYKPAAAETFTYNNFFFAKKYNLYWTTIQKTDTLYDITMHYSPLELENISVTGQVSPNFMRPNIYITFDTDSKELTYIALSAGQLSLNLARAIEMTPIAACTTNDSEDCKNRPIVTCDTENTSVIYLQNSGEAAVQFKGDCIIVSGQGEENLRAAERLLYQWYGIMSQ